MLVENPYPQDTRIRNEATLLTKAGYEVSVVALRRPGQAWREKVNGVDVYRIPHIELFKKTPKGDHGILGNLWMKLIAGLGYTFEYAYFTSACILVTTFLWLRKGFDVIHAHNPPDTLFLVALPFKLLGKKFIFDHHDLSPELYMSRYGSGPNLTTTILQAAERCSLKLANVVVATNESYRDIQMERGGVDPEKIFIVRNGPSEDWMRPAEPSPDLRKMNKKILCYVGALNPQDGVDYLLHSLHYLRNDLNRDDFHCVIMGSGDSLEDLRQLAAKLQLNGCVNITGFVSYEDLRSNLAAADICVDPDPSSPLNDVSTWIKIMEYMAFAKPIVTYDLKETRFSAQESACYVKPNDTAQFARGMAALMDDPESRRKKGAAGRERVETDLRWEVVGEKLKDAYRSILPVKSGSQSDGKRRTIS